MVGNDGLSVVEQYGRTGSADTGSTEVQVALLTGRIQHLTQHLAHHRKDYSTRLSLVKMVGKRRSLLAYLKAQSPPRHQSILSKLSLRK